MNAAGFHAEQRRLLAAMGYTLLERRPPPGTLPADTLVVLDGGGPAAPSAPLLEALQAAFGLAPASADACFELPAGSGPAWVVDLAVLRADPQSKSALWRRLRSLRRRGGEPAA